MLKVIRAEKHRWRPGGPGPDQCLHQTSVRDKTSTPHGTSVSYRRMGRYRWSRAAKPKPKLCFSTMMNVKYLSPSKIQAPGLNGSSCNVPRCLHRIRGASMSKYRSQEVQKVPRTTKSTNVFAVLVELLIPPPENHRVLEPSHGKAVQTQRRQSS